MPQHSFSANNSGECMYAVIDRKMLLLKPLRTPKRMRVQAEQRERNNKEAGVATLRAQAPCGRLFGKDAADPNGYLPPGASCNTTKSKE